MNITKDAVRRQLDAMHADAFEVGLFDGTTMEIKERSREQLDNSISFLSHRNAQGDNVYIRPLGEHPLSMVDDLSADAIEKMKGQGYQPAIVVETSPKNFQAWMNHGQTLPARLSTEAAKHLAEQFGGDPSSADWRHFGRLAGFTNQKAKYAQPQEFGQWRKRNFEYAGVLGSDKQVSLWMPREHSPYRGTRDGMAITHSSLQVLHAADKGLQPWVLLHEASGRTYDRAEDVIWRATKSLDHKDHQAKMKQELWRARYGDSPRTLNVTIDRFRAKHQDMHVADISFAKAAALSGMPDADIAAQIRSRDLSHKGNQWRQDAYVERTINKARGMER